jgi:hypothetical protein
MALMVSARALAVFLTCAPMTFADQPVAVLDAAISGHIHPSICQTPNDVLVVVYQGKEVLMCARSIQLDDQHIGTVFMNPTGIYFFKANLDRLTK